MKNSHGLGSLKSQLSYQVVQALNHNKYEVRINLNNSSLKNVATFYHQIDPHQSDLAEKPQQKRTHLSRRGRLQNKPIFESPCNFFVPSQNTLECHKMIKTFELSDNFIIHSDQNNKDLRKSDLNRKKSTTKKYLHSTLNAFQPEPLEKSNSPHCQLIGFDENYHHLNPFHELRRNSKSTPIESSPIQPIKLDDNQVKQNITSKHSVKRVQVQFPNYLKEFSFSERKQSPNKKLQFLQKSTGKIREGLLIEKKIKKEKQEWINALNKQKNKEIYNHFENESTKFNADLAKKEHQFIKIVSPIWNSVRLRDIDRKVVLQVEKKKSKFSKLMLSRKEIEYRPWSRNEEPIGMYQGMTNGVQ